MKTLHDIYILLDSIEKDTISFFMKDYIINMDITQDSFECFNNDILEFETENYRKMLNYVLSHKQKHFTFSFRSNEKNAKIQFSYISINSDNSLVLGITVYFDNIDFYVKKLQDDFDSQYILVFIEHFPPISSSDFKKLYLANV